MRTIKYKSDKKIEASQMEKKTEIKREKRRNGVSVETCRKKILTL